MTPEFTLPPLNQRPDELRRVMEIRLSMEKEVERVKSYETALKDSLINEIPKGSVGVFGLKYKAQRVEKKTIRVSENGWPALAQFIATTGRFDIMQKRVNPSVLEALWEGVEGQPGFVVPGTEPFIDVKLSVTKV